MKVRAPQADRYMTNGTRDVAVHAHGVAQQTATKKTETHDARADMHPM